MIDLSEIYTLLARGARLPATRTERRDAIGAIRTQVAAADLQRQASRTPTEPDRFRRAKTSIRQPERERPELRAGMSALPSDRDRLKDRITALVDRHYDDAGWARGLDAARIAGRP